MSTASSPTPPAVTGTTGDAIMSSKVTTSSFESPNLEWILRACLTMTWMDQAIPMVATIATSSVIRIQAADMRAIRVVINPTPKHVKMKARSACIPSTAISIEPSLPRKAFPLPQTETNVVDAVHIRFAQIEIVTNKCRQACERG